MQTVHVRVNDSATGQPTPCRVRFTDAAGSYHAPLGRRRENPIATSEGNARHGSESWAYIDGSCEILLPPGPIAVAICKGIEYAPLNTSMELLPGKLALRFTLERWTDLRKSGWYSGDGRVQHLSPHDVLLQAAGEDLAVVNLLVEECPSGAMNNIVAFSGQKPCLEMPGHLVAVNTYNVHSNWGSLALLHCHRAVYPLRLGNEGEDDRALSDWCDQCHRKKGLVVWACENIGKNRSLGPLVDLILGKIDAFELTEPWGASLGPDLPATWELLLDAGFRVPLIGSSGSHGGRLLGRPRTYAQFDEGEELSYRGWIEAVRAGRTFVTAGPLLLLTVDGRSPGSVIDLPREKMTVSVCAEAQSPIPYQTLEIVGNGHTLAQVSPGDTSFPWSAQVAQDVSFADGGWITAICWSDDLEVARTSPVYVNVAGKVPPARYQARQTLAVVLAELQNRAKRLSPPNQRLLKVLESATKELP